MNNKGFAITTILYGLLILFCMLLISLLGILSTYKNNMKMLIENTNGASGILRINKKDITSESEIDKNGLYCINGECKYYVGK